MSDNTELLNDLSASPAPQPLGFTRYSAVPEQEPEAPGFIDSLKPAFEQENLLVNAYDSMTRTEFPTDENYSWYDHEEELTKDIPNEFHADIARANSLLEAQDIRKRALKDMANQQALADAGGYGMAAMAVAGLLSPENLLPGVVITKGARATSVIKSGAVGAAVVGGTEAILASDNVTKDAEDVLYAASFGAVFGGAFGAALSGPAKESGEIMQKFRADLDDVMIKDADTVARTGMDDSAGAMRNPNIEEQLVPTTLNEDEIIDSATDYIANKGIKEKLKNSKTNAIAKASKITASDYTRLINNDSPVAKKMAYDLLEGGTGVVGRTKSAAIVKDIYEKQLLSKGMIPLNEQFDVWAKSMKKSPNSLKYQTTDREAFFKDVRLELEARNVGKVTENVHPAVTKAADAIDDMTAHAARMGKSSGWEAMQNIEPKSGYVPRKWSGKAIHTAGKTKSKLAITQGYMSVGFDLDSAQIMAEAVVTRALNNEAGVVTNVEKLLGKENRAQLKSALEQLGLTEKQINNIVKNLDEAKTENAIIRSRSKNKRATNPSFTKKRTDMDLTEEVNGVRLLDLVDNNLNELVSTYARDVSGRSALARKGYTNEGIWEAHKNAILKDNANVTSGEGAKLAQHIDDIKTYFTASPLAGGINPDLRRLQQSATLASLGMVGAAQLAELGTVIGRVGLRSALKELPEVASVFSNVTKVGRKAKRDVLDELRPILGDFDYDHLMYRPDVIIDDKFSTTHTGTARKNVDKVLGKGSQALGYLSGMNNVRHMEHRIAAKTMINKFAKLAKNPKLREKSLARMEDIGLDPKELDKVTNLINKYGEFNGTGTLTNLNLTKWPDDVAESFAIAINRHVAQVVQRQLAGETSNWMHKSIGSMLTQFRHFPIVAFEKQLLRNLHHRDQEFVTTVLYGFAVSYAVQSAKAALPGTPERDQEALIKQSINYMAMASIAPDLLTVLSQLGVGNDLTNFQALGKTGGPPRDFNIVDQVPVAGQINKLAKGVAIPFKAMSGDLTASDVRGGAAALPLSTTIFFKELMEAIAPRED